MELHRIAAQSAQRYKTTQAMVTAGLRKAILEGVLEQNEPVRQQAIARQFGVSRIPVREALRELEGEGLVSVYPHRGAVVTGLSRGEAQEIIEIRIALETLSIVKALPNLTEQDFQRAQSAIDATEEEDLEDRWAEINWQFHEALLTPANRPRLISLIKEQHNSFERYIRMHLALVDYAKAQREHRTLLEACRKREPVLVKKLWTEHLENTGKQLIDYLD